MSSVDNDVRRLPVRTDRVSVGGADPQLSVTVDTGGMFDYYRAYRLTELTLCTVDQYVNRLPDGNDDLFW